MSAEFLTENAIFAEKFFRALSSALCNEFLVDYYQFSDAHHILSATVENSEPCRFTLKLQHENVFIPSKHLSVSRSYFTIDKEPLGFFSKQFHKMNQALTATKPDCEISLHDSADLESQHIFKESLINAVCFALKLNEQEKSILVETADKIFTGQIANTKIAAAPVNQLTENIPA